MPNTESVSLTVKMTKSALSFHVQDATLNEHYQHADICFSENGFLCVPRSQPPQGDWYLCCPLPQRVRGSTAVRMTLTFYSFILGLLGLVLQVQRKLCNSFRPFEASLPALESALQGIPMDQEPSSKSAQISKLFWTGRHPSFSLNYTGEQGITWEPTCLPMEP